MDLLISTHQSRQLSGRQGIVLDEHLVHPFKDKMRKVCGLIIPETIKVNEAQALTQFVLSSSRRKAMAFWLVDAEQTVNGGCGAGFLWLCYLSLKGSVVLRMR